MSLCLQLSAVTWDWSWVPATLGGTAVAALLGTSIFFLRRWYARRGTTTISVGDRTAPTYVTRGKWDIEEQCLLQSAPRFMNFAIPLTIKNMRDVELTVRVKNVWFSDGRPEIHKGGGWRLPGSCLSPTGVEVRDAAGNISDPVRVPPNGIEHFVVSGTATSPVCHSLPYQSWRFVFIDWDTSPVRVGPFIQEVEDGRSFEPDLEPTFPLPPHYPKMQGGVQ